MQNFMLFSELQKQLSPSPIKTWRLLKQLRDGGRMRENDDWIMQDRKLYVNVPRFIVELEALGYANLKSDDFSSRDMKSDEFSADESKLKFVHDNDPMKSPQSNLKSDDFSQSNHEIIQTKNEMI